MVVNQGQLIKEENDPGIDQKVLSPILQGQMTKTVTETFVKVPKLSLRVTT